jgi:hypothetical protein
MPILMMICKITMKLNVVGAAVDQAQHLLLIPAPVADLVVPVGIQDTVHHLQDLAPVIQALVPVLQDTVALVMAVPVIQVHAQVPAQVTHLHQFIILNIFAVNLTRTTECNNVGLIQTA